MKFFFADSQDFIDPGYDFENDEFSQNRQPQRDDVYAHEYFEAPPYDGILVSRSIVGDEFTSGKYTMSQSIRFRRDGARAFLRYPAILGDVMGDCGAFSYLNESEPPYTIPEMVAYYEECGFSHAVSIDHVIRGFTEQECLPGEVPDDWRYRFDITLELAEEFLTYCRKHSVSFHPIGVAQGWSPLTYAQAAERLEKMGYSYIALGGLAALKSQQIHRVLHSVRSAVPTIRLHLFGFTKADDIADFVKYDITSFDSTSPLIRAFKDARKNFLLGDTWYSAVRVPYSVSNHQLRKRILAGREKQELLESLEAASLEALQAYSDGEMDIADAVDAVVQYDLAFSGKDRSDAYCRTLTDRPWEQCGCKACREIGINVIIFRGANRNRRRGFHNLQEFHARLSHVRSEPPAA